MSSKKNKMVVFGISLDPNHVREENDFYATEPMAAEWLLEIEEFSSNIWECAVGQGHLAEVFEKKGFNVKKSDIVDRGYEGTEIIDFLNCERKFDGDIITNPPFKLGQKFCEKALELIPNGRKVAMFLKVQFLEGQSRKKFFTENPPKTVWISSSRLNCVKGGDFEKYTSNAIAFAWYVWEKGYKGPTELKWFN